MKVSKLHQFKKMSVFQILECILYIEMNKKVPYKIFRKINIKNVTKVFKLIINKKINFKKPCNVLNINFSDYLIRNFFVYSHVKNAIQ